MRGRVDKEKRDNLITNAVLKSYVFVEGVE